MRVESIEADLQRFISEVITHDLRDPAIGFCTITEVRTSKDLDLAKVYFDVFGDDIKKNATLKVLNKSKGIIKAKVAKRIRIRKMPDLRFEIDRSLEAGNKIDKILKDINNK